MGLVDVEAEFEVGVVRFDCLDGLRCVGVLLFLLSRKTPEVDDLVRSPTAKELFSLLSWDVKARERVRGRKKPSLPSGMLRPWTTFCGVNGE
jgi:hypothetical protein